MSIKTIWNIMYLQVSLRLCVDDDERKDITCKTNCVSRLGGRKEGRKPSMVYQGNSAFVVVE